MKIIILLLLSCMTLAAQNVTNFVNGQSITNGELFSSVPSAGGGSPTNFWMTSFTPGSMRNNYAFTVGCYFTVGTTNLNITYLGCYVYAGSTQTHRIGIWKKTDTSLLAVVTNNFSGKSAGFNYISLASPVTLTAGASYALGVEEFSGGDNWSDVSSVYTTTGSATNVQAAYATTGGTFSYPGAAGAALSQYVGVSFIYQ